MGFLLSLDIIFIDMGKRLLYYIIFMLITTFGINAKGLKEARNLYSKGEYEKAKPLFIKEYKRKPKDASINHWLGVCYYETGDGVTAIKHLKLADSKDVLESSHYLAKIYMESYDFKNAIGMYERYFQMLEKADKIISKQTETEYDRAKIANSMFEHVEKIAIIDSIQVDKDNFFSYYQISPESGTLMRASSTVSGRENAIAHYNQSGDRMMCAIKNGNGQLKICESTRLLDGTWDTPQFLKGELNISGDADYPYLMQDGMTLYYAYNGEGTIGGYDIFMTRKDSETGEYLRPQNIGMPYNSFYDDYMLVLDDVTGLGWWATDRNKVDNKITIYVFVRNSIRENYNVNEDNLVDYAKILNYRLTWGDKDYSDLVRKIRTLETNASQANIDFMFSVGKGLIYTSFSDFKSDEAAEQMYVLLEMYGNLDEKCLLLKQKRAEYHKNKNDVLKDEIIELEELIRQLRTDVFIIENNVRNLEQNN